MAPDSAFERRRRIRGRPEVAANLLLTEDPDVAWDCIDQLLELNRTAAARKQRAWRPLN